MSFFQRHPSRSSYFLTGKFLGIAFLVFGHAGLFAQLEWDATTIHQKLALGQTEAEAVYHFENKGTYPVVIRSTSSSCGCTTAKLDRNTYYPGDKGSIVTHFDVGGRTGARDNTVRVLTNDPTAPSTTLTFSVEIPTLVEVTPRLVHWRRGESPEEKTVRVQVNPEADLEIKGVEIDSENFDVKLLEGEKPGEYAVRVSPKNINSPERVIISLQTDPEVENQHNFSFYAYVR